MIVNDLLDLALVRVGLKSGNPDHKNRARTYLNIRITDLTLRHPWPAFLADKSSSDTVTTVADTKEYVLSATAVEFISFRDVTNDRPLRLVDLDVIEQLDPDESETGLPRLVAIGGFSTTGATGSSTATFHPTPDGAYTIEYSFYFTYADTFTAAHDALELGKWVPKALHPALLHGVAAEFHLERGDAELAQVEEQRAEGFIQRAAQRYNLMGNAAIRFGGDDLRTEVDPFTPSDLVVGV